MKKQFDLYQYLLDEKQEEELSVQEETIAEDTDYRDFYGLCKDILDEISGPDGETNQLEKVKIQRGAIMGYEAESNYYKEKIKSMILKKRVGQVAFPPWYKNLHEGIFAELYGFAGLTPWIYDEKPEYEFSTSAKIIGDRIYFLLDGRCQLQEQRISSMRLEQLKRALLMGYPMERLERGVHEVYLKNGIRVTIFSGNITKRDNEVIVFRKYVMKSLSFEKLAEYRTIPGDSIRLLTMMVEAGFNVLFCGPVRSGKTTFLQTWQSYEDRNLEGVSIATYTENALYVDVDC